MQLFCTITAQSGRRVPLQLLGENGNNTEDFTHITSTVLRQKVAEVTKIPVHELRLIFRGRMIKDSDACASAIEEYKLEPDSVLHCMGKPVEEAMETETESTATATTTGAVADSSSSIGGSTISLPTSIGNRTVAPGSSSSNNAAVAAGGAVPPLSVASTPSPTTRPIPSMIPQLNLNDPLQKALVTLQAQNPYSQYTTGLATLTKVTQNILDHPHEEKYRTMKKSNAAFQKRLGGLRGGHACMLAMGFVVERDDNDESGTSSSPTEIYKLHATAEKWTYLTTTATRILETTTRQIHVQQQQQAQAQAQATSGGVGAGGTGMGMGMPGLGAGLGGGFGGGMGGHTGMPDMNDPNVQNMMTQMMSNPDALSAALQVRTSCMTTIIASSIFDCGIGLLPYRLFLTHTHVPLVFSLSLSLARCLYICVCLYVCLCLSRYNNKIKNYKNPMMQQMLRNDPNITPIMRQQMERMSANPAMMQQMASQMQNPTVQAQLRQAMTQNGTTTTGAEGNEGAAQQQQQGGGGDGNDQSQTEDEMIAEAIRRSLQDSM